jgi:hypothetical protein
MVVDVHARVVLSAATPAAVVLAALQAAARLMHLQQLQAPLQMGVVDPSVQTADFPLAQVPLISGKIIEVK